jgi:hypothetical protein
MAAGGLSAGKIGTGSRGGAPMELLYDHARYAQLQDELVNEMVAEIHRTLVEHRILDPRLLSELTYDLASRIGVIFDDCPTDQAFHPLLVFRNERRGKQIVHGKGTWIHECLDVDAIDALCGVVDDKGAPR